MEKQIKIALAGNPNSGKTTLFNALTGSNQFVGNWPGVTVEKKEGKLKKHDDVVIMDLPGIYSLSPYTMEEVVSRNYLITERPDAILNIIDGTNLERNLYLTTQLTELGIPVVIAINMMDIVRKNGDKINIAELSRELGCKIVEISALKGDGVMEAAEAAVAAAKGAKTVPMHTFSGPVEHAIAHIEEAVLHDKPAEQQRWYAIKIFERDDKVLEQLQIPEATMQHIEADIKAAEKELDDDAESIITNERYVYIAQIIKGCYKKKQQAGGLTTSDKIDKIVTNRWLGLPIFAVVMFLVYWIAMVAVGAPATDWANDGLFGDGWHLLGIGSSAYNDAADEYTAASEAVSAANDGGCGAVGQRLRHGDGALGERRVLKDAHRAVPNNRLRVLHGVGEQLAGLLADVEAFHIGRDLVDGNDRFIRTTDDYHVESVQRIFKKMYDKGDIYKGTYKGKYCTPCESFWTESQLKDGKCPDCGGEVHDAEEEAYFFRLSKYANRVRDLLVNTDYLQPRSRVNEMVKNFIDPGLEDLCVSRTSFTWGIPVTFDPKHVVYVWLDALTNYITALGYENKKYHDYTKYWPAVAAARVCCFLRGRTITGRRSRRRACI